MKFQKILRFNKFKSLNIKRGKTFKKRIEKNFELNNESSFLSKKFFSSDLMKKLFFFKFFKNLSFLKNPKNEARGNQKSEYYLQQTKKKFSQFGYDRVSIKKKKKFFKKSHKFLSNLEIKCYEKKIFIFCFKISLYFLISNLKKILLFFFFRFKKSFPINHKKFCYNFKINHFSDNYQLAQIENLNFFLEGNEIKKNAEFFLTQNF